MTMQQMNEYLEKRGFRVDREYLKNQGIYRFAIMKNGNLLAASFKYPETNDWRYRNERMQEFLEKIVRDFEMRFCITDMDVASLYPDPEKFWTKENPHVYISSARRCGKTLATIGSVFNTLDDRQREAVYAIIGKAIEDERDRPEIKDVIFNDPATIVFWADGTKTVVKCQEGDEFDPEKGLTMAIVKKVYGNKGSYCNKIKKWVEPYYEKQAEIENQKINEALETLAETAKKILGSVPAIKLDIESKKSDV